MAYPIVALFPLECHISLNSILLFEVFKYLLDMFAFERDIRLFRYIHQVLARLYADKSLTVYGEHGHKLQSLSKMVSVVYSDENDIELLRPSFVNSIAILANSLDAALNSLRVKFLNSISIQFFCLLTFILYNPMGKNPNELG